VSADVVKQVGSCESCLTDKQTRTPFRESGCSQHWKLGELLDFDIFKSTWIQVPTDSGRLLQHVMHGEFLYS
jgi:hypothetical protein